MTLGEFKASGGKDIYYPPEAPPLIIPEGYHFKTIYHMGKISFYKLTQIIIRKSCGC
jgi:hypothetical protein